MIKRVTIIWILGLVTVVPYGTYYLLFEAPRDEYALVMTLVLFWIFGFWGVVGPIVTAVKIRKLLKTLESVRSGDALKQLVQSNQSKDSIIELIASENHIPKFIASRIYTLVAKRLSADNASSS